MMTSRIRHVAFLSLLSMLLLISDDLLQQLYTRNNRAELELSYVLAMMAFSFALWASGRRWFVMPIIMLFASMELLQLAHISYIGQPLSPVDISRLYSEWSEVSAVLPSALPDHWPVLLVWGIPYSLLALLFWRQLPFTRLKGSGVAMLLVVLALVSKPDRATKRDMIFFMPGPTRSSLHNSLNAFSYYAVRMSFGRDRVNRPLFAPYRAERLPGGPLPEHIWVILGESVRGDRLGVYGYERDTTPQLSRLKREGYLRVLPGQAATVATGSTIPLFMNGADEPGNLGEVERKTANLFRLASASGYRTFWISAQESKLMSHVGEQWLDYHATREDAPIDYAREGDEALLAQLDRLPAAERDFGIIHTRSVHIPYEEAYERDAGFTPPWPVSSEMPEQVRKSNQYDNALVYFDRLISRILARAARLPGSTLVIITSDHGQMLGDQGRWGHNVLTPAVASIPMMLYAHPGKPAWPDTPVMTHNALHLWLAGQLGWRIVNPNARPGVTWFHGNNPYGDNLYVRITHTANTQLWDAPRQVSHWRP